MERLWATILILLYLGRNVDGAKTENEFVLGKTVTLRPPSGSETTITGVIWRHGENLAAEWSKGDPAAEFYREFKDRTDLDTSTGVLVIRDMTEQLAGEYSVEINNRRLEDKYVVKAVWKPLPPNVWIKAETTEGQRDVECDWIFTEKAGHVEYWWNTNGTWVKLEKKIVVRNNETTQRVKTFSCRLVNIAGQAESQPVPNPYYQETGNSHVGVGVGITLLVLVLVAAGLGYWKRSVIKQRLCPGNVANDETTRNTTDRSSADLKEHLNANTTT